MEFPSEIVLGKVKETIDAIAWAALVPPLPVPTIRHARFRYSTTEERPAIAIMWDGDEVRDEDESNQYLSAHELVMEQSLSIMIDVDLDAEDSGLDNTGIKKLSRYAKAVLSALRAEGSIISGFSDFVQYRSLGPDEDSLSDEARLVLSVIVLYRVRAEDPSILLATGVN